MPVPLAAQNPHGFLATPGALRITLEAVPILTDADEFKLDENRPGNAIQFLFSAYATARPEVPGALGIGIAEFDSLFDDFGEDLEDTFLEAAKFNDDYHCRACGEADSLSVEGQQRLAELAPYFLPEGESHAYFLGCCSPCFFTVVPPVNVMACLCLPCDFWCGMDCAKRLTVLNFCVYHYRLNNIAELMRAHGPEWSLHAMAEDAKKTVRDRIALNPVFAMGAAAAAMGGNLVPGPAAMMGPPMMGVAGAPYGYVPPVGGVGVPGGVAGAPAGGGGQQAQALLGPREGHVASDSAPPRYGAVGGSDGGVACDPAPSYSAAVGDAHAAAAPLPPPVPLPGPAL